jgi:xanthine dehydrogenase YagR molybdenum-binding subunit
VELRLPGLRQHVAPQPHVLLVGEASHRRRVAVDGKLQGTAATDVEMLDGWLRLKSDPSRVVRVSEVMQRNGLTEITETFGARPSEERGKYTTLAYGAQFVEVKVEPDLGTVRVTRALEVTACGTIINPKASHRQEISGVVWGIGMALQEATEIDHHYGRIMHPNLQHY